MPLVPGQTACLGEGSGTDTDLTGTPPVQVNFTDADRCLSSCTTHDAAHWPDTPWDQNCAASPCTNHYSPTFWTTRRLGSVATRVWTGAAWQNVESWTLTHSYPDPGDGTRAGLWLGRIAHSGLVGGTASTPDVVIDPLPSGQMNNRVDGVDDYAPMNWYRIKQIHTETGALVNVDYSAKECVSTSLPAANETNTKRCFPVYWTPAGATSPMLDWFHKYVVTDVSVTDQTGGTGTYTPYTITRYTYPDPPAWRHDVDNGVVPTKHQSWSVWRGYDHVQVTMGDVTAGDTQTFTDTLYLRGLHGDQTGAGGTRSVTVSTDRGDTVTDYDQYAGMPLESTVRNGPGGAIVSQTVSIPWRSSAKATRSVNGSLVEARYARAAATSDRYLALDGGRGDRHTRTATTYNDNDGTATQVADSGDLAVSTDDRCTTNTYAPANTTAWLKDILERTFIVALPCGQSPVSTADVLADTRTSFDTHAYNAMPSYGEPTQTETIKAWTAGTSTYLIQEKKGYDTAGRVVDTWDIRGANTHTAYTFAAGGGLTQVTTTNPALWSSRSNLNPAWGSPTSTVDVNGRTTTMSYDPLGRLTGVWLPGRPTTSGASVSYAYSLSGTVPSAVTTRTLLPDATNYRSVYTLYDSQLRPRQVQQPAGAGTGRLITDTFYDTLGRTYKIYTPYHDPNSGPSATLAAPTGGDTGVPAIQKAYYDGVGRRTASVLLNGLVEKWRSSTYYGGDHVDVTPPVGGVSSSTYTDAQGHTTGPVNLNWPRCSS